ncbi:MAG: hypothetical protein KDI74_10940 [Gammaproteobacteria bacterium]|nr:hypothetical protein [Gammaproteobacteria bacterium]
MENQSELVLAMDACADRLEYLNQCFPGLASPTTLEGVVQWRQRRSQNPIQDSDENSQKTKQPDIDIAAVAVGLLQQHSLEDVLELLLENHGVELSLPELIQLIGKQEYLGALKRDVSELLKNAVSFEQIATLWNDIDRPAFGGPVWTSRSISMLAG